jgi:2-octaprenyl-6-methoxyphenol hydroxylase
MTENNFDIAIIGSSFSGMTCALALAKISPQIKIALIEKDDIFLNKKSTDGRAYAISYQSLQLFKELEIYEDLQINAGIINDIKITDYKSPFILDFIGKEANNHEFLGEIIENHHIFEALKSKIQIQKNIKIFCPNYYKEIKHDHDVSITLDNNFIISSKILLACDGRFSDLRNHYQIPTTTKNYHQNAIVFKISHKIAHKNIAHEKFLPNGPLAILPLQNQNQSSIVWIVADDQSNLLMSLDDHNFTQQLQKKMENCLGEISIISNKFSYPLTMILAKKFYHQNMLLVGDASCGVHPIAGQGFNLAISNILILRQIISDNILSGLSINAEFIAQKYHEKSYKNAHKMVMATDILNIIFENKNIAIKFLRNVGLGATNILPFVKNFFIKQAGGIK